MDSRTEKRLAGAFGTVLAEQHLRPLHQFKVTGTHARQTSPDRQAAEISELRGDIIGGMSDVTQILSRIDQGDPTAAERLLLLVYDELRKLAAAKLSQEKPGQTLQATALVHEAYLRLVGGEEAQNWNSRGHFFASAAEAMRRILVDNARRKASHKRGGNLERVELTEVQDTTSRTPEQLLAIDDALSVLEQHDPQAVELFKLRYFAGCSIEEASELLGLSRAAAYRHWTFARAWILKHLLPCD